MKKLSKPTKTMIAFGVGACLFVSTAFADMMFGSGYDKIKSSVKYTASQLDSELESYTLDTTFAIKLDGEVLSSSYDSNKFSRLHNQKERVSINQTYENQEYEYYSYSDNERTARKSSHDDKLYVTEFTSGYMPNNNILFDDNPFEANGAAEIEKIIDAVVGNLKDMIHVDKNEEGTFTFNGKLNASQVPALVNAVSSFGIKQLVDSERNTFSNLSSFASDIYVTSIEGFANENEQGLLTQLQGAITFSGKDIDGKLHTIDINVTISLKDINKTEIEEPDVTNAIVEHYMTGPSLSEMYEGMYVNNIVVQQGSEIIKVGERKLVLEDISSDHITGSFEEIVYEGYEDVYKPSAVTFTSVEVMNYEMLIHYVDEAGNEGSAIIHEMGLDRVYFNYNVKLDNQGNNSYSINSSPQDWYTGEFTKVFE